VNITCRLPAGGWADCSTGASATGGASTTTSSVGVGGGTVAVGVAVGIKMGRAVGFGVSTGRIARGVGVVPINAAGVAGLGLGVNNASDASETGVTVAGGKVGWGVSSLGAKVRL
jgi:hypothetical protein